MGMPNVVRGRLLITWRALKNRKSVPSKLFAQTPLRHEVRIAHHEGMILEGRIQDTHEGIFSLLFFEQIYLTCY